MQNWVPAFAGTTFFGDRKNDSPCTHAALASCRQRTDFGRRRVRQGRPERAGGRGAADPADRWGDGGWDGLIRPSSTVQPDLGLDAVRLAGTHFHRWLENVVPAKAGTQVRSAATTFDRSGCACKIGSPPSRGRRFSAIERTIRRVRTLRQRRAASAPTWHRLNRFLVPEALDLVPRSHDSTVSASIHHYQHKVAQNNSFVLT